MKVQRMREDVRDEVGRRILDPLLAGFVRALAAARPGAFGHLEAPRILFVSAAARRSARASVRGFGPPGTPAVFVNGEAVRYEVALRPRFFLDATPEARARILAHELWHVSPGFDGTLAPDRRHGARPEAELEAELDAALGDFDPATTALWDALRAPGELRLAAWLRRPPSRLRVGEPRARYDEADLFSAVVRQG